MKWVVLCLVLANAAFFGWQLSRDREVVVVSEAAPASSNAAMVSRLLLVKAVEVGNNLSIEDLARQGVVDASFPDYVRKGNFSISVMSLREFDQLPKMLTHDSDARAGT